MLPLWMTVPGEEFRVEQVRRSILLITASGNELDLRNLEGCTLSVIAKTPDQLYGVFRGHRIAFPKQYAMAVTGTVLGKTARPVDIRAAQPCTHHCAGCQGCIH